MFGLPLKSQSLVGAAWLVAVVAFCACGSNGSPVTIGDHAYDAGGPVVTTDTCTSAHNCACAAGGNCDFTCNGSDTCNAVCAGNSTCKLTCGSGACTLSCGQDASCKQICASGMCSGTGATSDAFTQTCASGACDLQCTDVASCVQNTGSGSHNCSGCG